MHDGNSHPKGVLSLLRKVAVTGVSALQTRGELFLVELQEEKARLLELLLWLVIAGVLSLMFFMVLTCAVILMFPPGTRRYAALGFCGFYLITAVLSILNLRALWTSAPPAFRDTLAEAEKDAECLGS